MELTKIEKFASSVPPAPSVARRTHMADKNKKPFILANLPPRGINLAARLKWGIREPLMDKNKSMLTGLAGLKMVAVAAKGQQWGIQAMNLLEISRYHGLIE